MSGLLEHARRLVKVYGFSVIPIRRDGTGLKKGKLPALNSWLEFQTRHPTDDELRRWFPAWDPKNLAVVSGAISGIVVIDVDGPSAAAWVATHVPATPWRVLTHRGTQHFLQHPGGVVQNHDLRKVGMPMEVKADGTYVVAPPSVHRTGDVYLLSGDWGADRSTVPVYNAAWIDCLLPPPAPPAPPRSRPTGNVVERGRRYIAKMPCPPIEHGSDNAVYLAALRLVRDLHIDDETALTLLMEWVRAHKHKWDAAWVRKKIERAHRSGRGPYGSLL